MRGEARKKENVIKQQMRQTSFVRPVRYQAKNPRHHCNFNIAWKLGVVMCFKWLFLCVFFFLLHFLSFPTFPNAFPYCLSVNAGSRIDLLNIIVLPFGSQETVLVKYVFGFKLCCGYMSPSSLLSNKKLFSLLFCMFLYFDKTYIVWIESLI